jgi:hypothetical protein
MASGNGHHASASDAFADPEKLYEQISGWVREMSELRFGLPVPDVGDGPHALHTQLVGARKSLDRAEWILATVGRLHGIARETLVHSKRTLKVTEDVALQSRGKGFPDFVSTRERLAWLAGRTIDEETELMKTEVVYERLSTVMDELRLLHRGIDSYRRDIDTRLRILTWDRSLDR